jgi:hypothetical protein
MEHPNFKKAWALENLRPLNSKQNLRYRTGNVADAVDRHEFSLRRRPDQGWGRNLYQRLSSGLRLGTPSLTTRGMGKAEMQKLAVWMDQVVSAPADEALIARIAGEVREMCASFPPPGIAV